MPMLVIRREQMRAFTRVALERYLPTAEKWAWANHRADCQRLGEAGVRDFLRIELGRALDFGLSREEELQWFALLSFERGSDFANDPGIKAILDDRLRDGALKVMDVTDLLAAREAA